MGTSLYDLSVESFKQIVGGAIDVLELGFDYAAEQGVNPDDLLDARMIDDMLPLSYQLNSICHHSLGAIQGIQSGVFRPPKPLPDMDYRGYQQMLASTLSELESFSVEAINALEAKPLIFKFGEKEIPFIAEKFVMTFSLPNLNFHATTAYDLLRKEGVPLGKLNYLGKLRIG